MSDEELIVKIREIDKELYAEIVRRYEEKLLRYASYLIKDKQKAADIVQESFINAYINLNGFNVKKKFSSWIYRIVHNQAMNYFNKNKKEVPLFEAVNLTVGKDVIVELEKKEIIKKTHDCLKKIPVIYSEILVLFFLEEKSYEEISDILKIPMGTVATRVNRAKVYLKKICETKK